jgi:hypothetical protein
VFNRGFKAWCENVAILHRRELKLRPFDPLPPVRLAQLLDVIVWNAEDVPGLEGQALAILLRKDPDSWSAVTLSGGPKELVILNSAHRGGRPASNLMHELAHLLIGHEPARVDVSVDGILMLNTYSAQQEQEATWLAGALLLPRPALMHIRQVRMTTATALATYAVSHQMFDYRMRMSGVDLQFHRARGSAS